MSDIPAKLQESIEDFSFITTRTERQEYLIQLAGSFDDVKVPERIATTPYDENHRVPACESDAFVWAEENEDGTLKFWFDVLNPQGLSAMAMAVILDQSLSGAPIEQVANVQSDIVLDFFGKSISMGKGQGLMGIVNMVVAEAKRRLNT
ncbi:MAG: SufE family protein [Anaerolineae bacterium]|nr:SufE family protein [Anaerolineae bacterium]MCA9892927.1 SufE family protein [Anaerolineae bacterium]